MKTLFDAKVGEIFKIVSVEKGDKKILLRLYEFVFSMGQKVKIVAKSVFKQATLIEVMGYLLSVRSSLLKSVRIL